MISLYRPYCSKIYPVCHQAHGQTCIVPGYNVRVLPSDYLWGNADLWGKIARRGRATHARQVKEKMSKKLSLTNPAGA